MHTHAWGTQPEMFGPRHEHRLSMLLEETAQLKKGSRILDAAIGLGQLASRVESRGFRVYGVDASLEAAHHVQRSSGIGVVLGDLTRMPFRSGVFDGITSGETLEHLDDDRSAVREFDRILKEGGLCVATVPALESLWTASDDYYEHRRRYSRRQLRSLFEDAGLRVEKARYWGFPVVLLYDTLFLLPMNRRRARLEVTEDVALRSVARAGRSRALVSGVRALFALDRLFSWLPFGPGLLLVARRSG